MARRISASLRGPTRTMAGDRGYAPRPWVSKTHVLLLYESPLIKSAESSPIHSEK